MRGALDDLVQPRLQEVAHLGREAARGAAQMRGVRNDVVGRAGVEHADRNHRRLQRVDVARDDRLDRVDDLRADEHGVDGEMRPRGVAAAPSISIVSRSAAAIIGPGRIANSPTGRPG